MNPKRTFHVECHKNAEQIKGTRIEVNDGDLSIRDNGTLMAVFLKGSWLFVFETAVEDPVVTYNVTATADEVKDAIARFGSHRRTRTEESGDL